MINQRASDILDRLYAIDAAERAAGLPSSQRHRNVDQETGLFLMMIARSTHARSILEIGSSNGVSTIWLALAASEVGGHVSGMEIDPARVAEAGANLAAAGLAESATVRCCDALIALESFTQPLDLVFIDAEKHDYAKFARIVCDLARLGGFIIADNVISHDVSDYQQYMRNRPDFETVTLPLNRGLELSMKTET